MAISPCVCFSCMPKWSHMPELDVDKSDTVTHRVPKDVWKEVIFKVMDRATLLLASRVCKHWRYAAAKYYTLAENTLRGAGCFRPLIENFEASRHIIFMDVSSSMNVGNCKSNALQVFTQITGQIGSAIAVNGLYICKFANAPEIRFFVNAAQGEKFLTEKSELPDGTMFSTAVDAVYDKVLKSENKKETHLYVVSDMMMEHDNALNDRIFNATKISTLARKITFHYYPVKSSDNPALKPTNDQFKLIKDKNIPGLERKYSDSIDLKFYDFHVKKSVETPVVVVQD